MDYRLHCKLGEYRAKPDRLGIGSIVDSTDRDHDLQTIGDDGLRGRVELGSPIANWREIDPNRQNSRDYSLGEAEERVHLGDRPNAASGIKTERLGASRALGDPDG